MVKIKNPLRQPMLTTRMTNVKTDGKFNMLIAVTSSFLLNFVNGIPLLIGNITVYTTSYYQAYDYDDSSSTSESSWTVSLYFAGFGGGCFLSTFMAKYVSKRRICIFASCLSAVGMFSSYFALQRSAWALSTTLGAVCGVAGGLLALTGLRLMIPWVAEGKIGLGTSIVKTASATNSMTMNYFITFLINPDDKKPEKSTAKLSYFNQKDVLQRVPSVFLYLGLIYVAALSIGCLLIRERKGETKDEHHISTEAISRKLSREKEEMSLEPTGSPNKIHLVENTPKTLSSAPKSSTTSQNYSHEELTTSTSPKGCPAGIFSDDDNATKELSYKTILQSRMFHVCCLLISISVIQFTVLLKYYKLFGEIWIPEDSLLTNLATFMTFSLLVSRPMWGAAIDRFGIKRSSVVYFALSSTIYCWLYFMPALNRWLYCALVCIQWNVVNAHPVFSPSLPLKLLGDVNFPKVYAMQCVVMASVSLCTPLLLQLILNYLQWFHLFSGCAVLGFVALVFEMIFIPEETCS